jgi:hypothetical protein
MAGAKTVVERQQGFVAARRGDSLPMNRPLTPSLSPSDGERVAFRPGEGDVVHGPNAGV